MEIFREERELADIRMVQRVMDMFERRPEIRRMVQLNMEYGDLDDTGEEDYDFDNNWMHGVDRYHGYPRFAHMNHSREISENQTRSSGAARPTPQPHWTFQDFVRHYPINDSNTERPLEETNKSKEKAEKKRLKKQRQKEKKRLEKLEKEKKNPVKLEEEKVEAEKWKENTVKEKSKDDRNLSVKESASAELTGSSDSSEDESGNEESNSGDSAEFDMTSAFVRLSKIKLEQKPKPERRERKKTAVKEKSEANDKNEEQEVKKKDSATVKNPTIEDYINLSTKLGMNGNSFAASGDYPRAVQCFTIAIQFNPKEFKFFGNRSFCFERMQEYEKALSDAELCLRLCPGWVKGLFRKGRALAGLRRYEEAALAFREVLQLDSACGEAAQELMRVQITQLMEYGFTQEQSSNALIIHGTVKKALEVLSQLDPQPGAVQNPTFQPVLVANVSGVSPVLSANMSPAPASLRFKDAPPLSKPLGPVQNTSSVQSQPKPVQSLAPVSGRQANQAPAELFPIWIGNLIHPVSESTIANLFNTVGCVHSVKVLTMRRCAFVNFTKKEHCEEAIRRFNGYELNGKNLAVRYPDRIPQGMGISRSALKSDENVRHNEWSHDRTAAGGRRPLPPH